MIDAADVASYGKWPPTSIGEVGNAALLPTYTATGPVPTLPMPTLTVVAGATATETGDGWFDAGDTASGIVTVAGCTYPDAWDAESAVVPAAVCTGPARKRGVVLAVVTPVS